MTNTTKYCKTCGKELITDWDEGNCITCARDKILGEPSTTKYESVIREFENQFHHEESIYTHQPCEFLANNEDGKCNCQLKEFKQFLIKALEDRDKEWVKVLKQRRLAIDPVKEVLTKMGIKKE